MELDTHLPLLSKFCRALRVNEIENLDFGQAWTPSLRPDEKDPPHLERLQYVIRMSKYLIGCPLARSARRKMTCKLQSLNGLQRSSLAPCPRFKLNFGMEKDGKFRVDQVLQMAEKGREPREGRRRLMPRRGS